MKSMESPAPEGALPVLAIVGRPNVGKSAVFNRIARRRIAIVHEQSGVTRDRLVCRASCGDVHFDLVDTGGLGLIDGSRPEDDIEAGIRRQVDAAIEDAAAILFVVDVQAGVMPLDQDVARRLHQCGLPVYTLANKCDDAVRDGQAVDFERLGFRVFPVSALHGRGFDDVLDRITRDLPRAPLPEETVGTRVAIVGRPNVGKSSFVNRLLRADRVIVSNVPGTTIDSVDIPYAVGTGPTARHYVLTDTAGLRPARRVNEALERFSAMRADRSIRQADVVVHMLDAKEGPTEQDMKIADMIAEHGKGSIIAVNKWDLVDHATQREYEAALRRALPHLDYVPIVFISASSGYNIRRTIDAIDLVSVQIDAHLTTGVLNRTIADATAQVPPPMIHGKRFKIYYATQVGTRPVRIALFVNDPLRLPHPYRHFLVRRLRAAFGLEGAPVTLELKAKPR